MPKTNQLGCLGLIVAGVVIYSVTSNLSNSAATVTTSASQIGEIRETAQERRNATAVPPTTTPPDESTTANDRLVTFADAVDLEEVQSLDSWGVVIAPVLNQRSEPNTEALVVGTLTAGACVHLVGEQSGWYKTSTQGGESWSSAEYIGVVAECPTAIPTAIPPVQPTPIPQRIEVVAPATATPVPQQAAPACDPNYAGACIPIASGDLDCPDIGFSFQRVGADPHDFDRDNDGIACEAY